MTTLQQNAGAPVEPVPPRKVGELLDGRALKKRRRALANPYAPYLFLLPFVALFLVFWAYPLGRSFYLSFFSNGGKGRLDFVGGANYAFLLRDPFFWLAVYNTVVYSICFLAVQLPLALLLALALDSPRVRLKNLFRFAFFCTHLTGAVFVAVVFNILLGGRTGTVNAALMPLLGLEEPIGFLTEPNWVMPVLVAVSVWLSVGYAMIYFLAALQAVDRELYEAATVDGAGPVRRFWAVTLPGIRPVFLFLLIVGTIGALQLFELPYVLFQGGGPGQRGRTVVMYLYDYGFSLYSLGFASAVGWALVVLVGAVSVLQLVVARRSNGGEL